MERFSKMMDRVRWSYSEVEKARSTLHNLYVASTHSGSDLAGQLTSTYVG